MVSEARTYIERFHSGERKEALLKLLSNTKHNEQRCLYKRVPAKTHFLFKGNALRRAVGGISCQALT